MAKDTAMLAIERYSTRIGNRTPAFKWYHCQ